MPMPRPLKKGDIVDLIAPGYGIKPKEIEPCADYIRSLGLVPRIPDDLLGEDLFSSNHITARTTHVINALTATDSAAIWCIKGGYGTSNIIPFLHDVPPPKHPKLLIGFSDITALHLFIQHQWGWSSLHAPILWQCMKQRIDTASQHALTDLIFGKNSKQTYALTALNTHNAPPLLHSTITGGNLMLVESSIATTWQIQSKNAIIFLEDIDENAYRVDRMLNHLYQTGLFADAKALIFGDFTCDTIADQSHNITHVQRNFAEQIKLPCFKLSGIGHGTTNLPLPLGTQATINTHTSLLTVKNH